jgi:negative regulator of flagellin synthesis FlgM
MKIGPLESKPLAAPASDRKATPATADKAGAKTEASAQVAISDAGSLMAESPSDATFDTAKVERIASAIRDGKFQIDADKIAGKLISNAQDLLKNRTPT